MAETIATDTTTHQVTVAPSFVPDVTRSVVAIEAPGGEPGFWVGASSAVWYQGYMYLAYRLRYPIELGRGVGVVIARSRDGVHFERICTVTSEYMNAESLERPALVRTPDGKWRLYLSCATTGSKHWRVELLEVEDLRELPTAKPAVVMPGDKKRWGVKDPVIWYEGRLWHALVTFHPVFDVGNEDQMVTRYATSADGREWDWQDSEGAPALAGRFGRWDARGARATAVEATEDGMYTVYYDGRATPEENYEEVTGVATGSSPEKLLAEGEEPVARVRYMDVARITDGPDAGRHRIYYEVRKRDGAHELRTEPR